MLLMEEGRRVLDDSPLIVQLADERAPEGRKLLPPSGAAREDALRLERQLDHDFAPHVRRFVYFHMLPQRAKTLALFRLGVPRLEHALTAIAFPVVRAFMKRAMRIDEAGMKRSLDKTWKTMDAIAERLRDGRPYLTGDRFGATDIAFAAFAAPLVAPPEHPKVQIPMEDLPRAFAGEVQLFRNHPAGKFAQRVYRDHRAVAAS
jgi:glutathione S-transferase